MAGAEADAALLLLENTNSADDNGLEHNPQTKNTFVNQDLVEEPTSHHGNQHSDQHGDQHGDQHSDQHDDQHGGENGTDATPSIDIFISNVVCTFSVRCHLNLKKIGMEGINVEYKREYGKVNMRFRNPRATCTIWSSGRVSITGNNSEDNAKKTARRCARAIQKLGFRVRFNNFQVVNVLGTCAMPFGIKIAPFTTEHPRVASYEPELHPAVTYRLKSPRATLKIFSTGSITVTAPCVENVSLAIQHIYPLVEPHATKLREDVIAKRKMKEINSRKRMKLDHSEDDDEDDDEEDFDEDYDNTDDDSEDSNDL